MHINVTCRAHMRRTLAPTPIAVSWDALLMHYSSKCAPRAKPRKKWHTKNAYPCARFCGALACFSYVMHACICTGNALCYVSATNHDIRDHGCRAIQIQ
eukprot:6206173-Pleurochrysis_carterae.AAC.1